MNASAARLCLSICPALIVVTWGFLPRSADVPLLMVPLVMFGLECRRFGWTMAAVILITAAVSLLGCGSSGNDHTAVGEQYSEELDLKKDQGSRIKDRQFVV